MQWHTYLVINYTINKDSFCWPGSKVTDQYSYLGMIVDSQCRGWILKTGVHPSCLHVVQSFCGAVQVSDVCLCTHCCVCCTLQGCPICENSANCLSYRQCVSANKDTQLCCLQLFNLVLTYSLNIISNNMNKF